MQGREDKKSGNRWRQRGRGSHLLASHQTSSCKQLERVGEDGAPVGRLLRVIALQGLRGRLAPTSDAFSGLNASAGAREGTALAHRLHSGEWQHHCAMWAVCFPSMP
jgi:hypothetical protein